MPLPDKAYADNARARSVSGATGTVFGGENEVGVTIEELMKLRSEALSERQGRTGSGRPPCRRLCAPVG